MTIKKRWVLNLSLASVSFLGSLFFINKSSKADQTKEIPKFFNGKAPYIFAH